MVSIVWRGSRIFWEVNPCPVIVAPLPNDSTGVRTLKPTRTTAGIISPTYAFVLLKVSSTNAILFGSIDDDDEEDGDLDLGDCAVAESATCKVSSGVRKVAPPASIVCGGILNVPALSGITV